MKYKTFKHSLLELKRFRKKILKQFKQLGINSSEETEMSRIHLDNYTNKVLDIIADSITSDVTNDVKSTIHWLFWVVMITHGSSFDFNGREYDATIKNVYLLLKNELKPYRARIINTILNKEELLRAHGIKR